MDELLRTNPEIREAEGASVLRFKNSVEVRTHENMDLYVVLDEPGARAFVEVYDRGIGEGISVYLSVPALKAMIEQLGKLQI